MQNIKFIVVKAYYRRVKTALIICGIIAFVLTFILPFLIPPFKTTVSASFDYQFNNSIAVLMMYVLLLIVTILYLKFYKSQLNGIKTKDIFNRAVVNQLQVKYLYMMMALYVFMISIFYFLGANYGYGESNYFLLRVDRIKIGQSPYMDFEYAYGIILIYFPALMSKFLNLSTIDSYYLAYAFLNLLGLYFYFFILNNININIKAKRTVFFAVAITCIPINMGINYILIRFITPIVCLLVINNLLKLKFKSKLQYIVTISATAFVLVLLNLCISVEVGIALCIAIASYFYLSFLFDKNRLNLIVALIYTILIVIFFFLFNKNLLLILKVFAAGGNNFPLVPAPAILFFMLSFLFINAIFISIIFKKELYFIICSLLTFNLIMLPGAFGRCDPGHIFWYGLGSLIFMWAYLSYTNNRFYRSYTILFIIVFTIGVNASGLFLYRGQIAAATAKFLVSHTNAENKINQIAWKLGFNVLKMDNYINKFKPIQDFKNVDKYSFISIPFDADKDLYLHLLNNRKYSPEYYTGMFLNLYTPEQIATKLHSLEDAKHRYMIVPKEVFNDHSEQNFKEKRFLSTLFLFPFNFERKTNSQSLYNPIYIYIRNNYEKIGQWESGYYLVARKIKLGTS